MTEQEEARRVGNARHPSGRLDLDGTEHLVPGRMRCHCCGAPWRACPECGGCMHFQGIYGGYLVLCEECGNDDP